MVGQSRALLEAQEKAKKVAVGTTTVLLLGESGTGKELFARMIHDFSPRKNGPFVAINCAAIPRELLESELFGHERGSFTGATGRKIGKFELADKGTVFLDEIGDMDMGLQAKLLRVLEGDRFMRVGGTSPVKADVRVVAATNKDLHAAVAKHAFREDLYYRLNVFPLVIPPLRDRREILPEHIGLRVLARSAGEDVPAVGSLQEASSAASRAVEAKMIEKVLRETGGNKTRAAEILQVSYKTLLTKIKDYGLD